MAVVNLLTSAVGEYCGLYMQFYDGNITIM